ncbi:Alpha/beta hydrolase family protein [Acinetobacter venetianus]|uniref:Alpha/beta hydrolase family protein n=2 Tax=Acinetobacter venetianus TaxID=52133 RepID=A0A150I2T6_9GAMM|nr:Alpha/beta hydrolase family protein [Acinetobacter venetianus]
MGYQNQVAWQQIEQFLPQEFHIPKNQLPKEEWWAWNGNNIHLDTYRNPNAKIKVILFHGVGTNGRQMSMILGKPLADRGYETIAVDMPGYGVTQVRKGKAISYDDWVQAGSDLIDWELAKDNRPIVLYGLSAGGMLTYHVAAKNKKVKAIVGMTFLDTSNQKVKDTVASNLFMSRVGTPITHLTAKTPLASMRVPMSWASKMSTLVNNKDALKVFMKDKTSAGNSVSLTFLDSYIHYKPELKPEDFDVCPILLTQPEKDRWTPLDLSTPFLSRIHKVPVKTVILENAGHYPLEQPGLSQMVDAIDSFYTTTVK